MGTWCYDQVLSRLRGYRKIREGLHGACDHHRVSWSHKLLSFSNITANNTFHTPTGPTLLIVCHIAVMTAVAYGSYPSTHLTQYCLSISGILYVGTLTPLFFCCVSLHCVTEEPGWLAFTLWLLLSTWFLILILLSIVLVKDGDSLHTGGRFQRKGLLPSSPSHLPICRPLYPLILEQTGRLQQPLHQNKFQSPK